MKEVKKISLDTATVEELKAAAWDNLVQIEKGQKLQQLLIETINKKNSESKVVEEKKEEKVKDIKKVEGE